MTKEKRERVGTRRTTMLVLGYLKANTNMGNPVSVTKLVTYLRTEEEIPATRDSVKAILSDLMKYYPGPDQIRCKEPKNSTEYQTDYYYQTQIPAELQENINQIERVIRINRDRKATEQLLTFQFNGFGSDHMLHPTGREIEGVYPVRIIWAYGHPYLIGFFKGRNEAAHFRVDLMSLIRSIEQAKEVDEQREFCINQIREEDYLNSHLYMFYERPEEHPRWIQLRVKKIPGKPEASLTILQDTFGSSWNPVAGTETDQEIEVMVSCIPNAITQFVRQYMDRVRVVGPAEVVKEVNEALRKDFEGYFQGK